MIIHVGSFQPFKSRQGRDTVIRLEFQYDPELVALLKQALRTRRSVNGPAGGWLPEYRCWFVERDVWPMVRQRLGAEGHTFTGEAPAAAQAPPNPRPRPAHPMNCLRCQKLPATIEEWCWTLKVSWSDDAHPVIEAGADLLRELLALKECSPRSAHPRPGHRSRG